MSEYMHLVGGEQVSNAGHSMVRAAEEMKSAANLISESLSRHQSALAETLERHEPAFVDRWEHGCNGVCTNIELWVARCPHCGRPHEYSHGAPQVTAHPAPPALPPERIDELTRRLTIYADAAGLAVPSWPMARDWTVIANVGELRAILAATKRLVEAEELLRTADIRESCDRSWTARPCSTRSDLRREEWCDACSFKSSIAAFLSPAPATATEETR